MLSNDTGVTEFSRERLFNLALPDYAARISGSLILKTNSENVGNLSS
jgi:hypothetical protein